MGAQTDLDRQVRQFFGEIFDGEPEGIWAAPGRVNLIGEHTDYNGGLALPIALPQRTWVAARRRDDDQVRLASHGWPGFSEISLDEVGPGQPSDWARYPLGSLWAMRRAGHRIGGVDAVFASEVPLGSGLSSSAALEVALAVAARDLFDLQITAAKLADLCQQGENIIAQAPTGGMDQRASLCCAQDRALRLDCRDGSMEQVPFVLDGHGLLVINTRASHSLGDGQYGQRRADCEQACRELGVADLRALDPAELEQDLARLSSDLLRRRVRHVVTEIERVERAITALRAEAYADLGALFVESHASLRDDYQVSCPELDAAVTGALTGGAFGARMTGGGFGGSAIALIPEGSRSEVEAAIVAEFERAGFTNRPQFLVGQASAPAGLVSRSDRSRD